MTAVKGYVVRWNEDIFGRPAFIGADGVCFARGEARTFATFRDAIGAIGDGALSARIYAVTDDGETPLPTYEEALEALRMTTVHEHAVPPGANAVCIAKKPGAEPVFSWRMRGLDGWVREVGHEEAARLLGGEK